MIPITAIIFLLVTHWVADFVFQTDWMARNKSKQNYPLFVHMAVYTLFLLPFALIFLPTYCVLWFLVFNFFLHGYIDYQTSRVTSRLAAQNRYGSQTVPNFGMFSIIGLDQMLHYLSLFGTYYFFINV